MLCAKKIVGANHCLLDSKVHGYGNETGSFAILAIDMSRLDD